MERNWYDEFLECAEKHPHRRFIRYLVKGGEKRWTYMEGAMQVVAIMDDLAKAGLARKERVVWYEEHAVPCLFFKLACAFAGLPYSPLSPGASVESLERIAVRLNAGAVLTSASYVPRLIGRKWKIFSYGDSATAGEGLIHLRERPGIDQAQCLARLREAARAGAPSDILTYMPTSGTTSDPKLAEGICGRQYASEYAEARGLKFEPQERILCAASFAHESACCRFRTTLSVAPEYVVPSAVEAKTPLADVQLLDPTVAMFNPRVLNTLYKQHVDAKGDPAGRFFGPSLRYLRTSGAKPDLELLRKVHSHGVDVGEEYGSTETGPIGYTPLNSWRPGFLSLTPWVEGKQAPDGELLVRTGAMINGYLGSPVETAQLFTADGFVKTGDIVEMDDRWLRHKGRKKEVLNAPDGTNIYAVRIEDRILGLPWVEQVVLIGDQKPYLSALIVVKDKVSSKEADGFLAESLHTALYERAASDMKRLNQDLEVIEKVRRVALFAQAMPVEMYRTTTIGKIGRVRHRIDAAYAKRIEHLYA